MTLDDWAVSLNEVFLSFKRAGFTDQESLYLTGQYMTTQLTLTHLQQRNADG